MGSGLYTTSVVEFQLEVAVHQVHKAFAGPLYLQAASSEKASSVFLDTFDWRLFHRELTLHLQKVAGRKVAGDRQLKLRDLNGGLLAMASTRKVPTFLADIPTEELQQRLRFMAPRRLLPVAELSATTQRFRLLDRRQKTVVRMEIEEASAQIPSTEEVLALPYLLRISSVRGYEKEFRRVMDVAENKLGLKRHSSNRLVRVFEAFGKQPGDYSSRLRIRLVQSMSAEEATRLILRELLSTILVNENGTKQDLDSEFLHDFRVAIRRTRSALSQIKKVFPAEELARYKSEFSWLGSLTGPTRDLDVYLLKIGDYKKALPQEVQDDLDPLETFLKAEQKREQRKLAKALVGERYCRLVEEWAQFLAQPVTASEENAAASLPVKEVAAQRIWKVYRRILKKGNHAVAARSPAAELHDLRIDCKKLRYLMEFFRSLFPQQEIGRLIKVLKRLQENLGDFNDYEVQRLKLEEFSEVMLERKKAPAATLIAMGRLVALLEAGQEKERVLFAEQFQGFAQTRHQQAFSALFRTFD